MSRVRILAVGVVLLSLLGGFFLEAGPLATPLVRVSKQKQKVEEEEDDVPKVKPKTKKITSVEDDAPPPAGTRRRRGSRPPWARNCAARSRS